MATAASSAGATANQLSARLVSAVASARNPDGGWGYFRGKASRLEPTAWVALSTTELSDGASAWLAASQGRDGWLRDDARAPVNYGFNALALIAVLASASRAASGTSSSGPSGPSGAAQTPPSESTVGARLASVLIGAKGLALPPSPAIRQDNSLQGWPWLDGTFSWAEPTACAVLGLKRAVTLGVIAGGDARDRIDVGERLLVDRACAGGGWNYGNARVFGKDLPAHVPPTALALLALQDRRTLASDPEARVPATAVNSGLDYLASEAHFERSGIALALTSLCLRVFERSTTAVDAAINTQIEMSLALGNVMNMAALLAALSGTGHNAFALRSSVTT
jgi:hypothetical protein